MHVLLYDIPCHKCKNTLAVVTEGKIRLTEHAKLTELVRDKEYYFDCRKCGSSHVYKETDVSESEQLKAAKKEIDRLSWHTGIPAFKEVAGRDVVYRYDHIVGTFVKRMHDEIDFEYIFYNEPAPSKYMVLED